MSWQYVAGWSMLIIATIYITHNAVTLGMVCNAIGVFLFFLDYKRGKK